MLVSFIHIAESKILPKVSFEIQSISNRLVTTHLIKHIDSRLKTSAKEFKLSKNIRKPA
jgi:hypothetical protein